MPPLPDGPATNLDDLYLTLRPEPLTKAEEFKKYYRGEVNKVRGEDKVDRLSLKLRQAYDGPPFKAFLMGHPGVGKSTEVSRLLATVEEQFVGVQLSIATELNPASFKVFDVLILMMALLADKARSMETLPLPTSDIKRLASDIEQWFGTEEVRRIRTGSAGVEAEAGTGLKGDSPLAGLFGFFASIKANLKYADERRKETIEYRPDRLRELVDLCNRLIVECSHALRDKTRKEWLLVVEDLDKTGISPQQLRDLFIQHGTVFRELRVNIIFTIPVWLAYSPEADRLPFERFMIHDTPVYDKNHESHRAGRDAVKAVLEARASPSLFAEGQMTKLVEASGGNLRDLFALVLDAGEGARLENPGATVIGPADTTAAINKMRRDYRMKLGESPYDAERIPYPEKWKKLLDVYRGAPNHDVPDRVLYSLLRARAVQEFNGPGWFGVHPLVVDILKDQGHLQPQDLGGTG